MRVLIVVTAAMVVMVVTVVAIGMVFVTLIKERKGAKEVMYKSYLVGDIVGGWPVELADIVHCLPGPVEARVHQGVRGVLLLIGEG